MWFWENQRRTDLTCDLENERQRDGKWRSEIKKYGLIYGKSEYREIEDGGIDLKRRKKSRFVGVWLVEVGDSFWSVFEFCGGDPWGLFFSSFVSSPFDEVLQLAFVLLVELGVEDFRDFVFRFAIDIDRRWRWLDVVGMVFGVDDSRMETRKTGGSRRVKEYVPACVMMS